MTPKEKQISFYNRYFVFKKIASVDVDDVFQSVTGVRMFQEKLNRKDTLTAQMVASQMMLEEGEGAAVLGKGKGTGTASYRPTKESELKLLGEKGTSLGLSAAELEGADTKLSKLFGSKAKDKTVKTKSKSTGAEAVLAEVKGYSDKDIEKLDKSTGITLKKKSALSAVKLPSTGTVVSEPGAAAAIIEKSKLGMKESSSKLVAEKAKEEKQEESFAAVSSASASEVETGKSKDKKKSSAKIGSIKLNPDSIASLTGKLKSDGDGK
jgi:hypothetical protein